MLATCVSWKTFHVHSAAQITHLSDRSFYTTEEQIHELFSKLARPESRDLRATANCRRCGEIKRLVMGLDRFQKTPCGFCFVEYFTHQQACDCMRFINGTKLDERVVR